MQGVGKTRRQRVVAVIDDDQSVRESLPALVQEFGYAVQAFSSAQAFLASEPGRQAQCLILDVAMPGMSGPELQVELARRRMVIPIIYITAHADEPLRARLLAGGAVDCLYKPFSERALLDALSTAFAGSLTDQRQLP